MKKQIPVLILIGPPGCGKGTQGDYLAERLEVPKLSTGDLLRNEIKSQTELGKKLEVGMGKGGLVDDQIVLKLLKEKVKAKACEIGFILDGFPRSLIQAQRLEGLLEGLNKSINLVVIDITVSDKGVLNRITNRYYCSKCKTNYNKLYKNPRKKGVCDVCGERDSFAVREDDTEEVVKNRLVEYRSQTAPVISYYEKKGGLFHVDGNKEIGEVTKKIDSELKKILTC